MVDDLLQKKAEREAANAPEVQQLTAELRKLTTAGQSIEKDYNAGVEVLEASETGDFVKELVAKGSRRNLEEKYQSAVDDALLDRLAAEYQNIEAQRQRVLNRLAELRPGVDFTKEAKQQSQSKGRTNSDDPLTH